MLLPWLRKLVISQPHHPKRRRPLRPVCRAQLSVERLEDRIQPSLTWSPAAPLPLQRHEGQTATVNGLMYVFSGFTSHSGATTPRVDRYDPGANSWTRLSDMPYTVTHAGVAVDGQTVYLAGGWVGDVPGVTTNQVLRYDVPTDSWSQILPLPEPRAAGGLVRLGRELHYFGGLDNVEGGSPPGVDRGDHWVLNLDSGTGWTSKAPLPNPRNHLGYADLNGKAYAIGGQHLHHEVQSDVHAYDPATNAWTAVASLPSARGHQHNSTFVLNGRIVTIGGSINDSIPIRDVTEYNPVTNTWAELTPIPQPRAAASAQHVNGRIVITGGSDGDDSTATTWTGVEMSANQPPMLDPIADRMVPASTTSLMVPLSATDPEGDPITFTATAVSLAHRLDAALGYDFFTDGNFWQSYLGLNEKWVQSARVPSGWAYVRPDGQLFAWDGGSSGSLVGNVGAYYWADPNRLIDVPATPHANLSVMGTTLTVTRAPTSIASAIYITVTANDGRGGSDSESFTVTVTS